MSDTENTPTESEATAELAKLDDASLYIEERNEQENVDRVESEAESTVRQLQEKVPELKEVRKASRYERLKRARDQYKAEAEELRSRLGQSAEPEQREAYSEQTETQAPSDVDTAPLERSLEAAQHLHGDAFHKAYEAFVDHCARTKDQATYQQVMTSADVGQELINWHAEQGYPSASPEAVEAAMQQGRQEQDFQQQLAARDEEIRIQTEARLRSEAFAATCSDFHEVIQSVEGVDDLPPVMLDLIRRSQVGPEIAYLMARDFWDADTKGLIDHAQSLAHDPVAQARMVGNLEQAVMYSRGKGSAMQTCATKAPPPLSPVRGGASAPKDLHSLAKSDSADEYIRARRSAR